MIAASPIARCRRRTGGPAEGIARDHGAWNRWTLDHVETADPVGSPQKPLTQARFEAKFRDCARHAARPLSGPRVDAALEAIGRLETLPDMRELMTPFAA